MYADRVRAIDAVATIVTPLPTLTRLEVQKISLPPQGLEPGPAGVTALQLSSLKQKAWTKPSTKATLNLWEGREPV